MTTGVNAIEKKGADQRYGAERSKLKTEAENLQPWKKGSDARVELFQARKAENQGGSRQAYVCFSRLRLVG